MSYQYSLNSTLWDLVLMINNTTLCRRFLNSRYEEDFWLLYFISYSEYWLYSNQRQRIKSNVFCTKNKTKQTSKFLAKVCTEFTSLFTKQMKLNKKNFKPTTDYFCTRLKFLYQDFNKKTLILFTSKTFWNIITELTLLFFL